MLVDLRPGLREYLISDNAIAAIVNARVYPVQMPQAINQPSLVYHRISEFETYHMQGPTGLMSTRYQIDAWALSADVASALADAVKERLGGFSGIMSFGDNSPADFVRVQGVFFTIGRDLDYDADRKMYGMSRDYLIWYED